MLLNALEKWLKQHLPEIAADLNPGVDEHLLDTFSRRLNAPLPDAFKALYRWHNGQRMAIHSGPWYGLSFLTLEQVIKELDDWQSVIAGLPSEELREMNATMSSTPPGFVKCEYSNPLWIPFAYDYGGNYLGIDLAPGMKGHYGQVINFGRDEKRKIAVAPDLNSFIMWMLKELKLGNVNIREEEDGGRSFNTLHPEKYHFLDSLAGMFPAQK
ncbi:SMI1/KNR4 family protein [Cedecea neteri]|uniref:SMI1/KNR4 family protein n=1 Tax=Cedecea neteri TaxID=158822 RepID=UPI0005D7CEEA|nr:SMI1/KNR4 family protein [Cedecea neteri]AJZ90657.1 beta-1 3-glucan biosynthesis protein [Klebsiella michiganensis]WPU24093.1 SMI1/KNR4 family protein [Cedecea neteri]